MNSAFTDYSRSAYSTHIISVVELITFCYLLELTLQNGYIKGVQGLFHATVLWAGTIYKDPSNIRYKYGRKMYVKKIAPLFS